MDSVDAAQHVRYCLP